MIIGVRAHDFGKQEPESLASSISSSGFQGAQLALKKAILGIETDRDITPRVLERIAKAFLDSRVEISVLGCYVEPSIPDANERMEQVKRFKQGVENASFLGAPIVATETTRYPVGPEFESGREAAYLRLKDSVLRMVEQGERLGIDIGIEPVADHTLNSVELTKRLLEETDSSRLKIVFDPVNMLLPGDENRQESIYRSFLTELGNEIAALHMKDIVFENNEKVWRNLGSGIVAYDYIFEWALKNKPDIPILREHVRPDSSQIDLEFMRKMSALTDRDPQDRS